MKALIALAVIIIMYAPAAMQIAPDFDRLSIPRMGLVDAPIIESMPIGDTWEPSGGWATAMRFLPNAYGQPGPDTVLLGAHSTGLFQRLPMLVAGDVIVLTLDGATAVYAVRHIGAYANDAWQVFAYQGLVLVTCTSVGDGLLWAVFAQEEKH